MLRLLGRNAEAIRTYRAYQSHPDAAARRKKDLGRILPELELLTGQINVVVSDGEAKLFIDGRAVNVSGTMVSHRVDPGPHTVVAERRHRAPVVETVDVNAQQTVTLELRLSDDATGTSEIIIVERDRSQAIVGVSVAALGAVGLGFGVVFGVLAVNADAEAASRCSASAPDVCDDAGVAANDKVVAFARASTASFVIGGVALAAGLAVFFTAPDAGVDPVAAVAVAYARGGPLLTLSVGF